MINILEKNKKLLLHYTPDRYDWVREKFDENSDIKIVKTFRFTEDDLQTEMVIDESEEDWDMDDDGSSYTFILGILQNGYYKIRKDILGTKFDVLLSKELTINRKTFVANREISIFPMLDKLINEPIVIGGSRDSAIPITEFDKLIKNFPTSTEVTRYAHSRISLILKEYLGTMTDAQKKLNDYLKKKKPIRAVTKIPAIYEYEIQKFEYIRTRIQEMLKDAKDYSENEWRDLMLEFILLIFPKYIAVLKNVNIKDHYSKVGGTTDRYIDVALIDANGNLDVIEIKQPFDNCLLSNGKYRDNYTPKNELSGTIMQAEKYLFYLAKWGVMGEDKITEKYKAQLPGEMKIKITNPKAIVIAGRSNRFLADQNFDFEIMKRKYSNVLDIITYDDLLARLENIIAKFKKDLV